MLYSIHSLILFLYYELRNLESEGRRKVSFESVCDEVPETYGGGSEEGIRLGIMRYETLAQMVDRRVLRWFGNVERMDKRRCQEKSKQLL